MSLLRHGSTRRHLPSRGHCMKEGRRSGADGSPSHELGGYELKGKNEQEGRQQTIEITENRGERVQTNITHLQSYIICMYCLHFIQNLLSSFSFVVLQKVFIFLAFPTVCSYFLPLPAPSPPYSLASFPASLSISFFMQHYLSL